uniref:DUF569 domain-containing protein n=1 Tax=Kalanchoe fedtschenkoi TaxID=63787 RepID=A0A7N1A4H0_KALFE
MDLFGKAKAVRLRSCHDKYLMAHPDGESVWQGRDGTSPNAVWTVESVPYKNAIRLRSCFGKYLTASDDIVLLGVAGRRVTQTSAALVPDYSLIEWEPVRDGVEVKLRTATGHFLRANGGLPPVRNSVTHDIPRRSITQECVLWDVEPADSVNIKQQQQQLLDDEFPTLESLMSSHRVSSEEGREEAGRPNQRLIYYSVMDGKGNVVAKKRCFWFTGTEVGELKQKLAKETGLRDFIVCLRNPFDGKLDSLKLYLPPNNDVMRVLVVPSASKAAKYTR